MRIPQLWRVCRRWTHTTAAQRARIQHWDSIFKPPAPVVRARVPWMTKDGVQRGEIALETSALPVVAVVNDIPWDLTRIVDIDTKEPVVLDVISWEGLRLAQDVKDKAAWELARSVFWHSAAHVLGCALEQHFGDALKLEDGPSVASGFFYDAHHPVSPTNNDHKPLQRWMRTLVGSREPFLCMEVNRATAQLFFQDNPSKLEMMDKISPKQAITLYRCGPFIDLCRGPHVPHAGYFGGIQVTHAAATHQSTIYRVHGIAFPTKKELKEWEEQQKELLSRDHQRIGKEQQLFLQHPFSPGSPLFLPHGTRIWNRLMEFLQIEYRKRGYEQVRTPLLFDAGLWRQSGHLEHYSENMFLLEEENMGLKPMNCPAHCLLFASTRRSVHELPIRWADFSTLHRNELSGTLRGLTRLRTFHQDDAHIFCAFDQVGEEIDACLSLVDFIYRTAFHFGDLEWRLSTMSVGDTKAERLLQDALERYGQSYTVDPGEGAFYAPKIDVVVTDAMGREWQCATIQLDFELPERFDLHYKDTNGQLQRPVMIHRAVLGSFERFLALLMEHTKGKWPLWLSPRQGVILPVHRGLESIALEKRDKLREQGWYVDTLLGGGLSKRIRTAHVQAYTYTLILGDEECATNSVRVRSNVDKGQDKGVWSWEELESRWKEQVAQYA